MSDSSGETTTVSPLATTAGSCSRETGQSGSDKRQLQQEATCWVSRNMQYDQPLSSAQCCSSQSLRRMLVQTSGCSVHPDTIDGQLT